MPLDAAVALTDERDQHGRQHIFPAAMLIIGSFDSSAACLAPAWRVPLRAARKLAGHHDEQWSAEMISRDPTADDHAVAAAKRRIDLLNRIRVDLVAEIDTWVDGAIGDTEAGPLHTETIGSVVDRLAIAWVRRHRLTGGDRQRCNGGQAALASRQFRELARAYDDLVLDVAQGRRRVPRWRALKSYGDRP
ncbi:DUF4254 domain-containing protein [Micromonospora sp. NPDC049559]|uniref:DUF4254 domain-containing protein n=1 Tax=Micromonospora sp. NPDC049559 TaxID=3155923 RepID=UPI003425AD56